MAQSFDFYRPPLLADPSLRLLDRRGIWTFGGVPVLAMILVLAAVVRFYHLGQDPPWEKPRLGPVEASVVKDWQKGARQIDRPKRREVLAPVYHTTLRLWGEIGSGDAMLRFHSVLWALALIALAFAVGAAYFEPPVGALAALLLAVSPPFVAISKDINPTTEAAVWLALNYACLLAGAFRQASRRIWAVYALTGVLAVACHPLSVWVILVQALVAMAFGPRERRNGFYGGLAGYAVLIAVSAGAWFYLTRPLDPAWQPDWIGTAESGWFSLVSLLGAGAFWGTEIYPSSHWPWILASAVLVLTPLLIGGMAIRQRFSQDLNGFLLFTGVLPPALILLAPERILALRWQPTEVLVLTLLPLALWAASSIHLGLRRTRRPLTVALAGGGLLLTLWTSSMDTGPDWKAYQKRIAENRSEGQPVLLSRTARLADIERDFAGDLDVKPLDHVLALEPATNSNLLLLEPLSPLYQRDEPAGSPAPIIRDWLEKNCRPTALAIHKERRPDKFFRLLLCRNVAPAKIRDYINRQTFYDPSAWESLRFERWYGPFDPGFDRGDTKSRVVRTSALGQSEYGRVLAGSHAGWEFEPNLEQRKYYLVFIPFRASEQYVAEEQPILWQLPDGTRKTQVLTKETSGFSFLWEVMFENEKLTIDLVAPGAGMPYAAGAKQVQPPLAFRGVGIRLHSPYVVDVGAPLDEFELGEGWYEGQKKGDVTYRAMRARATVNLFLPAVGAMPLEGRLLLRVAHDDPQRSELDFEVFWGDTELKGVAKRNWDYVTLPLPEPPGPGEYEIQIHSSSYRMPDRDDSNRRKRVGIMIDRIEIQ